MTTERMRVILLNSMNNMATAAGSVTSLASEAIYMKEELVRVRNQRNIAWKNIRSMAEDSDKRFKAERDLEQSISMNRSLASQVKAAEALLAENATKLKRVTKLADDWRDVAIREGVLMAAAAAEAKREAAEARARAAEATQAVDGIVYQIEVPITIAPCCHR